VGFEGPENGGLRWRWWDWGGVRGYDKF